MTVENKMISNYINKVIKSYKDVLKIFSIGFILVAFYGVASAIIFHIPFLDAFKNFFMQIMGVFLPGIMLYVLLFKGKQNLNGAIAISYSLGYASNILSYFLLVPIGGKAIVPYFVIILALISFFIIFKKGKDIKLDKFKKTDYIFVTLFFVFLVLNVIAYAGTNMSPVITESAWYPSDIMFWVENTAALAREFPTTEPRVHLDYTLYYHYFSSVQVAFLNLATGVDCFTLCVPMFVLGKCIIFFGSFYVLMRKISKVVWIQLLGVVVVCFSSGFDSIALTTFTSHTWTHPFGFDIGFAFGALFLYFFMLQLEKEKFDWRVFVLTVGAFANCVGLKAPVAVVVIVVAGIVCIYWLANRKIVNSLVYGGALLASFVVVAFFCIGMFGGVGESSTGQFSLSAVTKDYSFFSQVYPKFSSHWPEGFKLILLAIAYCFSSNPLVVGLFMLATFEIFVNKSEHTPFYIGLLLSGFFGMALGVFNVQPGNSQMYFTMSAIIPCLILGCLWLNHRQERAKQTEKNCIISISYCMLLLQVCFMFFQGYTYWGQGLNSALKLGYKNVFQQDMAKQEHRNDGIQKQDVISLEWIRDNTPKDSVVLADRSVVGEMPKYMFYGAFSERQMYLEGDIYYRERYVQERERMRSLTKQVYQNSKEALQETIQDGVDYIVQTKWLTPNFVPDSSLLKLVHSSDTINVYEVIK